ncbi:hypothetical protein LB506_007057 [Fusarium annulatum]|nr:hypothetical protein LB506_007057 [Fusarium annulatum]
MSAFQTPTNQQTGSVVRGNNGETSGEITSDGTVSNDNNDDGDNQVDATQVQTSSQAKNNTSGGSQPQRPQKPRSKRGKYISKACNECKRRKSKCNGQNPCVRCVQHSLNCVYAPSSSLSQSDSSTKIIKSLSQQVTQLQDNLHELRKDRRTSVVTGVSPGQGPESASGASLGRPPSLSTNAQDDASDLTIHPHAVPPRITPSSAGQPRQPAVNYTFNLELARQHLRAQGSRAGDSESSDPANISEPLRDGPPIAPDSWNFTKSTIDPLWFMDKQEALRLCQVYEEEIGNSYPFLTLSSLVDNAHKLYDAMEAGSRSGFAFVSLPGPPLITADEIDILRLALSSALTIETSGSSGLGNALFVKAKERMSSNIWESPSLESIQLFTLMGGQPTVLFLTILTVI